MHRPVWVGLERAGCAPVVGLAQHVHGGHQQPGRHQQPVQLGVEGRRPLGSLVEERACLGVPIRPSVIGMGMV
eukprot:scaffold36506_cov61-Phaeocystis_antarctica.AAC.1